MSDVAAKLAGVAAGLENPTNDSTGHQRNRFVSLAGLLDHVRPVLLEAGLAVFQDTSTNEFGVGVSTRFVSIESGESLETGRLAFPTTDPQRAGAVITYAKRYQLLAALGIAGSDDDKTDGDPPESTVGESSRGSGPTGPEERPASRAMIVSIQAAMTELGLSSRDEKIALVSGIIGHDIASSNELTLSEGTRVLQRLDEMRAEES